METETLSGTINPDMITSNHGLKRSGSAIVVGPLSLQSWMWVMGPRLDGFGLERYVGLQCYCQRGPQGNVGGPGGLSGTIRKHGFVKCGMSGDNYLIGGYVKAMIPSMIGSMTQKNRGCGARFKFVIRI
nr:hypothetical protein [Tanacetum cinerariifolium]